MGSAAGAVEETKESVESSGKEEAASTGANQAPSEMPPEIRAKLRRLDKMEARYHGMTSERCMRMSILTWPGLDLLKAYRGAHSRVLSIEPFEAALRENTPLASIGEPKAFTEYLNQISLKGEMVTEELKRVTTERDDYKKKMEEAQKSTKAAMDEVTNLKKEKAPVDSAADANSTKSSPEEESEEFFSFDNEVPRLESDLKERKEEVETLKSQTETLKRDLSVARESTEGMVQNLESATRDLGELHEAKDKQDAEIAELKKSKQAEIDDLKSKLANSETTLEKAHAEAEKLKADLTQKTEEIEKLREQASSMSDKEQSEELNSNLENAKAEKGSNEKRMGVLQSLVDKLQSQLKETEAAVSDLKTDVCQKTENLDKLQGVIGFVDGNLKDNEKWQSAKVKIAKGQDADFEELRNSLAPPSKESEAAPDATEPDIQPAAAVPGTGAGKKKNNKKKKKGGKGAEEPSKLAAAAEDTQSSKPESTEASPKLGELETKIESLTRELGEKEAAIDRLSAKLKGEDDLKEEIESLRDDLTNIGQEFVEAKDKIKELSAQKTALEETIIKLEKELADARTSNASKFADSEKAHNDLREEFETLKSKSATLETDLSAAQQLAATRFKDLTDLRETFQKLQPELKNLRAQSAELKITQENLTRKTSDLTSLENKHDDLRAQVKSLKSTVSERDAEVKTLNQKIRQETDSRLKAEEGLSVAQSDLRFCESKKQEAVESREKTATELSRAQDQLKAARTKLREVESQSTQLTKELDALKEDVQLKTAQHASAQSLMNSMRDQGTEIGMQMKEARERCESLDEELADAHRLLSERTREGETMRRLFSDIEGRADAKVRDFKERMEAAIEERDRAEEDASTQGRRRARELEDIKSKIREAEKALRTAEEDKEELEQSQKDWRRRRDELEGQWERSSGEVNEMRQAMTRLRDSLDESEKQVRDLEKEKAELRRSVEETNSRLEKLRKSNRVLADEARLGQGRQSSRSSMDSGSRRPSATPVSSKERSPSVVRRNETPTGPNVDYIYLKNVLLQFLEQRDKNYQKQLIPVLGMLLHFDR